MDVIVDYCRANRDECQLKSFIRTGRTSIHRYAVSMSDELGELNELMYLKTIPPRINMTLQMNMNESNESNYEWSNRNIQQPKQITNKLLRQFKNAPHTNESPKHHYYISTSPSPSRLCLNRPTGNLLPPTLSPSTSTGEWPWRPWCEAEAGDGGARPPIERRLSARRRTSLASCLP